MSRETFGLPGLILRTTTRAPARVVATLVALGCAAFGTGLAVLGRASVDRAVSTAVARLGADLLVVPKGAEVPLQKGLVGGLPMSMSLDAGVLDRIATVPGVASAAPQYFLASAAASCCDSGELLLVGFDPERDFTITPWVARKTDLLPPDPIWVGAGVQRQPGQVLKLYDIEFRVAARLDPTGIGYFDNAAFIPLEGVRRMLGKASSGDAAPLSVAWDRPSAILIRSASGEPAGTLADRLARTSSASRVVAPADAIQDQRDRMKRLGDTAPTAAAVLAIIAALVAIAAQVLHWSQRRAALGLLVSLGARPLSLLFAHAAEALVLGTIAAAAGVGGALIVLHLFAPWARVVLGLPMLPTAAPLTAGWVVVAVLAPVALVVIAAVIAVAVQLSKEPYALVRRER